MDNSKGQFEEINDSDFEKQMKEDFPQVFKKGEIIEIRGSRFRVQKILRNRLVLKLLKKL